MLRASVMLSKTGHMRQITCNCLALTKKGEEKGSDICRQGRGVRKLKNYRTAAIWEKEVEGDLAHDYLTICREGKGKKQQGRSILQGTSSKRKKEWGKEGDEVGKSYTPYFSCSYGPFGEKKKGRVKG